MADITKLHPILQKKLEQLKILSNKEGLEFVVSQTFRTKAEQDSLYAQGRTKPGNIVTNAKFPYSFHNHGVAFDFVPLTNGKADWQDLSKFKRIGELGKTLGLEWGGDWAGFPDRPHLQYTQGKTITDFVNGYKLKDEIDPKALEIAEENLKVDMDLAWKALEKANKSRASLALLKGVPVKKYSIISE